MWPNPQETADSVTFTGEILNGKLHFCAVYGDSFDGHYDESMEKLIKM